MLTTVSGAASGTFARVSLSVQPTRPRTSNAQLVIIPSQCDYLSTHGIDQILKLIELIKGKTNPFIESRILITMFDKDSTASRMICTKLKQLYPGLSYETLIELDPRIREAQIMSMPVLQYNQESKAGRQYLRLAKEILGRPHDDK